MNPIVNEIIQNNILQHTSYYQTTVLCRVGDDNVDGASIVRPLLKQTQLESRSIQLIYTMPIVMGWNSQQSFHRAVWMGRVQALVFFARRIVDVGLVDTIPKGWASMGGAQTIRRGIFVLQ